MLTQQRARRLARQAQRRRADGSRGRRAQRAWTRLTGAGDAGDQAAADAVWHAWLDDPDDERWDRLVSWRGSDRAAEDACDAAVAGDDGAAVARFCAGHGIAPADPVRRAVFFLLTGQGAQLRAADPDGSLLAVGYAAAAEAGKARMRPAMAAAGGLDLVQVLARGTPRRQQAVLTAAETRYLTGQLAARRDWAGLWQLTAGLPVLDAVTALRQFGDGWQPSDAREQALYRVLGSADPAELARARSALSTWSWPGGPPASARMSVPGLRPVGYLCGAMTADAGRLALIAHSRGNASKHDIVVVGLPGSGLTATEPDALERHPGVLERYRVDELSGLQFAFAGDTLIVKSGKVRADSENPARRLAWYADGKVHQLPRLDTGGFAPYVRKVAPWSGWPGGFVLLGSDHLAFYTGSGDFVAAAPLHRETWLAGSPGPSDFAAEPGGMLAVAGDGGLAVFDTRDMCQGGPVATAQLPAGWPTVHLCGAGRILTLGHNSSSRPKNRDLLAWQLDGTRLERRAARQLGMAYSPVVVPGRDLIAVWDSGLRFLNSGNLADAEAPEGMPAAANGLWNSPGLDRCVLAGHEFVEVHSNPHPAAAIADRAPGQWAPQDLTLISGAMRGTTNRSRTWPLLELLRACLEYRFGTDIGLGAAARLSAREDDITL